MTPTTTRQLLIALLALFAVSGPIPALANGIDAGKWAVMAFGGYHDPDAGQVDAEVVYGIRGAYAMSNRLMVIGSLGRSDFGTGDHALLDANVGYALRPHKRLTMLVTGGIGHAFVNDVGRGDSFTMNFGIGPAIGLNHRLRLRILNRYRWFANRNGDSLDHEITVALIVILGQE